MTMIYLDNSATTKPSEDILQSFVEVNKRFFYNPASIHLAGRQADELLEKTREQILSIVEAPNGNVIYTSGGTEANNLAFIGFARKFKHRGNHILTTKIEHPSIMEAAKQLEKEGFEVEYLPVNEEGVLSLDDLAQKLRSSTTVVSIMHVNNEIGAIQPIEACAKLIKERSRAIFHVDAVQSFGKLPISMKEFNVDAITISGHKIHGLKGSGALITQENVLPEAINYGGGQENTIRSGTVAVPNAATLARAMRMAHEKNQTAIFVRWRKELITFLEQFPEVTVLAKETAAPHILSIAFAKITGEVAINYFQKNNIIISTSSACSSKNTDTSHVIHAIRLADDFKDGVIRISFGNDNDDKEIQHFKKVFKEFIELLRRGQTNDFK